MHGVAKCFATEWYAPYTATGRVFALKNAIQPHATPMALSYPRRNCHLREGGDPLQAALRAAGQAFPRPAIRCMAYVPVRHDSDVVSLAREDADPNY